MVGLIGDFNLFKTASLRFFIQIILVIFFVISLNISITDLRVEFLNILLNNFYFNIFFNLKITDILYTFVIGNTEACKNLNLKNKDFSFCVELPIKANKMGYKLDTSKSNERARIGGRKKVNAFKDGLLILISMFKLFFKTIK